MASKHLNRKKEKDRKKEKKRIEREAKELERKKLIDEGKFTAEELFAKEKEERKAAFKHRGKYGRERLAEAMAKEDAVRIMVDCSYDNVMTKQEIISLDRQLRHCYSVNLQAEKPVHFSLSSFKIGGSTQKLIAKQGGSDKWSWFTSEDDYLVTHNTQNLVYLTAESDNEISELESGKTYIIGGIVDHNRLKGIAHKKATEQGIATARLPLEKWMKNGVRKVLTITQVFSVMVDAQKEQWATAFKKTLAPRWQWEEKEGTAAGNKDGDGENDGLEFDEEDQELEDKEDEFEEEENKAGKISRNEDGKKGQKQEEIAEVDQSNEKSDISAKSASESCDGALANSVVPESGPPPSKRQKVEQE